MKEGQAVLVEALWGCGLPVREIARRACLTPAAVRYYVEGHREECPKRYGEAPGPDKVAEMRRLRDRGMSYLAVGVAAGVPESTAYAALRRGEREGR